MIFAFKTQLFPAFLFLLAVLVPNILIADQLSDARADILQAADKEKNGKYVRQRFVEQMEKPLPQTINEKMLVIGDSHAQDFYNALLENNLDQRYQIRTRRIPAICGLYLGSENIKPLIEKKHLSICENADTLTAALPQIKQADVIILAANWKLWSAQRLPETVKNLQIQTPKKLFVIGRKTFGKLNLRQYLNMSETELKQLRNPVFKVQQEINQTMKQSLPESIFVNTQALLCNSEQDCPIFTPQTRLISFDGGHLTPEGAHHVGKVLLQNPPLNEL